MAALVEEMFYVREKPWHGLGTRVEEAPTSEDAIRLAGLDWSVAPMPVYDFNGKEIPGYKANTRDKDMSVLGIVGGKYSIVQNKDAFEFTDSLLGEGLRYETAGSLRNGKQIWLLGKMPETEVAGDKFEPYICFTNTHDGSGAVRACMTPIRVVCNNTLNMALQGAQRSWSTRHSGDVKSRLDDARKTLMLADIYMKKLEEHADKLANEQMSYHDVEQALTIVFPLAKDATDRQKNTVQKAKNDVCEILYYSPDLIKFCASKWGFVNAVSDYVGHADPARKTKNWQENRWSNIIGGHPLLDRAMAAVA